MDDIIKEKEVFMKNFNINIIEIIHNEYKKTKPKKEVVNEEVFTHFSEKQKLDIINCILELENQTNSDEIALITFVLEFVSSLFTQKPPTAKFIKFD